MSAPKRVAEADLSETDLATADVLGTEIVRLVRLFAKAKSKLSSLNPGGIEHGSFPILATLVNGGSQRTSSLAECLHTEISTISRQTSHLVQQGLIERQADPQDGRACLLAPTEAGRELYAKARQARNEWLASTWHEWDPADRKALITLLAKLNSDLATSLAPTDPTKGDSA